MLKGNKPNYNRSTSTKGKCIKILNKEDTLITLMMTSKIEGVLLSKMKEVIKVKKEAYGRSTRRKVKCIKIPNTKTTNLTTIEDALPNKIKLKQNKPINNPIS